MTSIDKVSETVTVIGLGAMGTAIAEAFLQAGYFTTVWNRTPSKADKLIAKGAKHAPTVAEAVEASQVVVVCVLNYKAVHEILAASGKGLADRILVNLNTGTSNDARDFATKVGELGAQYIDGAIMNVPQAIGDSETLLFYGGSEAAFIRHQSTLMTLGGKGIFLGTDPGLAKLYELGIGTTLLPALLGFLQGAALVGTAGVKAETLVPYATDWLNMIINLLPQLAQELDTKSYTPDLGSLNLFAEGIAHDIQASKDAGIDAGFLLPMKTLIDKGISAGYGSDSISRLIEFISNPAN